MRITVLSGKGGVGKSMLASSLAILFSQRRKVVAIDCDVDAPNMALWLGIDSSDKDKLKVAKKISTTEKPVINSKKCKKCGKCITNCNFNALEWTEDKKVSLVSYRCEGCGLCEIICPYDAIELKPVLNCTLSVFNSKWGFPVVQGQIKPGEAESGEAVIDIREYAKKFEGENSIIIQDAAAGIGCPIIASVRGSDFIVAVAEPSRSSFSDLQRVLSVVKHFKIRYGVVVNKYDLNPTISRKIESYAKTNYLGKISYDNGVIKSIVNLKPIMETEIKAKLEIKNIYKALCQKLELQCS